MRKLTAITLLAFSLLISPMGSPLANMAQAGITQSGQNNISPEAEEAKVTRALDELIASMNIKSFTYDPTLPDPFLPFISDKAAQTIQAVPQEMLTGMRKYEPGQLQLVAILFSSGRPMAMVQDSAGKGYVIRRGTRIGRSGIVSDIIPNKVVIKQLVYSITKKKKYKTVEMVIRKEGEK